MTVEVICDRCGYEDGTSWFGPPDDERALCTFCIARVVEDIEDQRQALIFEQRWRTIQNAEPSSWAVHLFHAIPAPWCSLCTSGVTA